MGGKTSTQSKNKYNAKAYEQLPIRVKTGEKDKIKSHAEKKGMSLNAYVIELIKRDMDVSVDGE